MGRSEAETHHGDPANGRKLLRLDLKIRSARDSVVGLKRWVSASASTHPT